MNGKTSLKILNVHDDCTAPGGSNNYRRRLSALLRREGIEVFLFTQAIEDNGDEEGYYCYRYLGSVKLLRHLEHFYYNRSLINALKGWIRQVKPDLIHIHNNYIFPASVLRACMADVPIIQTVHDFRLICMTNIKNSSEGSACKRCLGTICKGGIRSLTGYTFYELLPNRFLRRMLYNAVDRFIAPSRALESELKNLGVPTLFLPHFVDTAECPETPFPMDSSSILFVGYLHPSKGVDTVLKAFTRVIKEVPSAVLKIVGDGPEAPALKGLCKSLNIGKNVSFFGAVSDKLVNRFYQRANVVVLPSIVMENSPLTIYEAMAFARPVLASDIGGIPDLVINGENGLLFKAGDEEELSLKLIELFSDKETAKNMGISGRLKVESTYTPEIHLERYMELIGNLV